MVIGMCFNQVWLHIGHLWYLRREFVALFIQQILPESLEVAAGTLLSTPPIKEEK